MTERRYTLLLWAIVLVGVALRIASARGGLWLDEAWSAQLAQDAKTPIGVFLNINHDNNHHLNSLWLQVVGLGAPPLLQRALSIATGTIAIPVAASIFRSRGPATALIAAVLFASCPMIVTMGSEARGYATMTLALLVAILLTGRWLADDTAPHTPRRLAWCFALGALSQMTMVFGCIAVIGWVFFALWQRSTFAQAAKRTAILFTPAVIALGVVLGLIFGAAYASPTGFQFGDYDRFEFLLFLHALIEMLGYTIGWPIVSLWLIVGALVLVVLARRAGATRLGFYRLAIVAFPLTLAVLQAGNPGHPRYYLVASIALLLMLAEMTGTMIVRGGWQRLLAGVALVGMLAGYAQQDVELIGNQRGNPDPAIAAMMLRAPKGTTVLLDRPTGLAVLDAAAAHYRYPLTVIDHGCAPARFLFVDRFKGEGFETAPKRCGGTYRAIASATARGLSGTHWTLYERQP